MERNDGSASATKKRESSEIYEVSAMFGSEFQKDAEERFLRGVIQACADFYAKKHEKNKIVIEQKQMDMNPTCKGPQGVCYLTTEGARDRKP